MTPRGLADHRWIPPCRFDQNVLGRRCDHGIESAYDSGQSHRLARIRDDHVIGIKTSATEFDLASGTSHEIGYGHVIAAGPYVAVYTEIALDPVPSPV